MSTVSDGNLSKSVDLLEAVKTDLTPQFDLYTYIFNLIVVILLRFIAYPRFKYINTGLLTLYLFLLFILVHANRYLCFCSSFSNFLHYNLVKWDAQERELRLVVTGTEVENGIVAEIETGTVTETGTEREDTKRTENEGLSIVFYRF